MTIVPLRVWYLARGFKVVIGIIECKRSHLGVCSPLLSLKLLEITIGGVVSMLKLGNAYW
jgi:hypothetical protein